MHDVKVPFCIPEFSNSKIISHHFHVDKNEGKSGIVYDMIIGCYLVVQLVLLVEFNHQVLQWNGITAPMKELISLLGQSYLTIDEMRELVIQTAEIVLTREDNERLLKLLRINYAKENLKQVANNKTQLNAEERINYIGSLKN